MQHIAGERDEERTVPPAADAPGEEPDKSVDGSGLRRFLSLAR